jgi:hypothetical protein
MEQKYKMTISRLTVDKLGVKLYDRVSAVIAEIVANSYDADATEVVISAPMGEMLARKVGGKLLDQGLRIEVADDGLGMLASDNINEVNDFYLKVGAERRTDPRRGDRSKKFGRRVMGRKGVGKLAPFGVCRNIEVITSGGQKTQGVNEAGKKALGYVTSHFILDRDAILWETDAPYFPKIGALDGKVRPRRGTTVRMTLFDYRKVPEITDFERQMAQRFGLQTGSWRIILRDSKKGRGNKNFERVVGSFEAKLKAGTQIHFSRNAGAPSDSRNKADYDVTGPSGTQLDDFAPGFLHEGKFYPVIGWVGYSKDPYKDDLMAGVRIYCRGKIAGQTPVFNLKAGFTGEHDVRSYFIGELHADWLDEREDLIRTDRQDILWSHDLGQAFQAWGQSLVKLMGRITREPMRQSAWEKFKEVSSIEKRVNEAYPGPQHRDIRKKTLEMAETMARTARGDELADDDTVESFVQLSLLLGPHITLDEKLREAAETKDSPLAVVSEVLKTARIAELASFGRIADDRIRVIHTLEKLKDSPGTLESAFQKLLVDAPWLIDPSWSPISANQSFETLKSEFSKFYEKHTGRRLLLDDFSDPSKRADFVLSSQDEALQIIEIKRPGHALENEEMERINTYYQLMRDFLDLAGNQEFQKKFPRFQITLVCDRLKLSGVHKSAFEGLVRERTLTHINWRTFLLRTRRMHEEFLNEASRQKKLATIAN